MSLNHHLSSTCLGFLIKRFCYSSFQEKKPRVHKKDVSWNDVGMKNNILHRSALEIFFRKKIFCFFYKQDTRTKQRFERITFSSQNRSNV